jgi:hypothetical protein
LKPIQFYSGLDERMLWRALDEMPQIAKLELIDQGYAFSVDRSKLDWDGFKDLLGLYIRYRGSLKVLEAACPDSEVRSWFLDPARDWYGELKH